MKQGRLVIIEGIDGSGKDTQADILVKEYGFLKTRLPEYDYDSWKLLRKYINNSKQWITEEVFQWVMMTNYIEHLQGFILPEILRGNNVVMTRFLPSMIAYWKAFDIDVSFLKDLSHCIFGIYARNIGVKNIDEIYLRIPVDIALDRIDSRAKESKKKESLFENKQTLTKVSESYDSHPFILTVDGTQLIEDVHCDIRKYLKI